MKKIILNRIENSLFNLQMLKDEDTIGRLTVYPRSIDSGWVDIYIEEKWRCKWLTKSFAKFLLQSLINTSREYNLNILWTRLNDARSLRLLDFFGFIKYNQRYYYLDLR